MSKQNEIMQFFEYKHLPPHLQKWSADVCEVAVMMNDNLPDSDQKSEGLKKLLEAKDCFVRAALLKKD